MDLVYAPDIGRACADVGLDMSDPFAVCANFDFTETALDLLEHGTSLRFPSGTKPRVFPMVELRKWHRVCSYLGVRVPAGLEEQGGSYSCFFRIPELTPKKTVLSATAGRRTISPCLPWTCPSSPRASGNGAPIAACSGARRRTPCKSISAFVGTFLSNPCEAR